MRAQLLGGTSLICLSLLLADPSHAADALVVKAPPASFYERFYVSLEGSYVFNRSPTNLAFGDVLDVMDPMRPGRNGVMGGVSFGRTMGPTRDWRIGWQGTFLGTRSASGIDVANPNDTRVAASNRFWFQTFDAEMGFRPAPDSAIRWFLGARVLNANNTLKYSDVDVDKVGNFAHRSRLWGVGPRAGVEATVPLQSSSAFLTMTGAASAIFSRRSHDFEFNFNNTAGDVGTGVGTTSFDRSLVVYNLEGAVSLGYRISSQSSLQIGYRAQQWWNIVPNISGATTTNSVTVRNNGDALVHGPFARLTVTWP